MPTFEHRHEKAQFSQISPDVVLPSTDTPKPQALSHGSTDETLYPQNRTVH